MMQGSDNKTSPETEIALNEALTALGAAKQAVDGLQEIYIVEMKCLSYPPQVVMAVAQAVLILLSSESIPSNEPFDTTWKRCVGAMMDSAKFLEKIKEFQAENIAEGKLQEVRQILADPENVGFEFDILRTKNMAAAHLGKWVANIVKFNKAYKVLKSLESRRVAENEAAAKNEKEANQKTKKDDALHTTTKITKIGCSDVQLVISKTKSKRRNIEREFS